MTQVLDGFVGLLRAIVTAVVTPPAGFLWLALLGVLLGRILTRSGRLLGGVGLAGLYITGTPIASHALMSGLEATEPSHLETPPPSAIIVLGGDGHLAKDNPEGAVPGPVSIERLAGGAALARETGLPVLITGGSVGHGQPPVSDLMAASFEHDFGLAAKWREERSENTCENASLSAPILRHAGIASAWVVTHPWHMKRALLSFQRAGYPVRPAPLAVEFYEFEGFSDLLPHMTGWVRSYYAFHEWIGLFAYRMGACPHSSS